MSNNLKHETSPYLLQHAENPVEWFPWCNDAFEKAKAENKPVFLSIGYSTCHWCHVMAHESFDNEETAKLLNTHFISVKVDREERPDIDSVYMTVCQALTGNGGWPMSIFMTWDKKPFFAGTYFPPQSRYGMPSFTELLNAIANEWQNNRDNILNSAESIINKLKDQKSSNSPISDLEQDAFETFTAIFDKANGGFGSAPKFPTPHNLLFLMLYAKQRNHPEALKMAQKTLWQMRKGGIFDQIGYGFSRYSTDKYYLVPHFEKMLYDNALLIIAYTAASKATDNLLYLDTAEKTAEYILREMKDSSGGFYSAQDADSEGVEGKYYTFTLKEILKVLGKEKGEAFAESFDITEKGNFEGTNIPNLLKSNNTKRVFEDEKKKLYEYRKKRYSLHLDDKILLSQNSMMISALAILYRATNNNKYLDAAIKAEEFIQKYLSDDTLLYTSFRNGKHTNHSFIDDYAYYISALLELYNSTLNENYLKRSEKLCKLAIEHFYDSENTGFYISPLERTELFMNPKESYDGAIPSANSIMYYNFIRLYQITQKDEYDKYTQKQYSFMAKKASEYPSGHTMFLCAKLLYDDPPMHITIAYNNKSELDDIKTKLPLLANITLTLNDPNFPMINSQTTYYICKENNCLPPANEINI